MQSFRKLTFASFIATFVLITIGGLVRATDSGLGCSTDWPGCNGALIPDFGKAEVVIEFAHRITAGIVALLIAAAALAAIRHLRARPPLMWTAIGAFGLVLFQAWLGRAVVRAELHAGTVLIHLATALTLLAVLTYLVTATRAPSLARETPSAWLFRRAGLVGAAVFALLLVGSYLAGFGDQSLVRGWPLMAGEVVPNLDHEPTAVHFAHRVLAAVTFVIVLAALVPVIKRKREFPLQAKLAHVVVGLFAFEIALGALNVITQLNPAVVTLHLASGAAIWAALVGMACASLLVHEPTTQPRPVAREFVVGAETR